MSPEPRTRSSLSPLAARGAWLTGGAVASLALVFSGIATPASASATGTPTADIVVADPKSGDDCRKTHEHNNSQYPNAEGKAQKPGGPRHDRCEDREECSDIDSVVVDRGTELSAVLTDGRAYAGERDFTPTSVDDYDWEEISDNRNFPKHACAISISAIANDAWIKVLTTNGRIWETHGERTPVGSRSKAVSDEFDWDERWKRLTTPDDDDLSSTREKGELATPLNPTVS